MGIRAISAITLLASDMRHSIAFYETLGFEVEFRGEGFTTLRAGDAVVNLIERARYRHSFWGRVILQVNDVDALHRRITEAGLEAPQPQDASWGERYFHIRDPDGHEVSVAQPIDGGGDEHDEGAG